MIAISPRNNSFSDRWIEYCEENNIKYILIDVFDNDVIKKITKFGVTVYLCHPPMYSRGSSLAALSVIKSCEMVGVKVFPSSNDYWHFDDKIKQKYIFENLNCNIPETVAFYEKEIALEWAKKCQYPTVFKLKAGAGSINVKLVEKYSEAKKVINKMFADGYPATDAALKDVANKIRSHRKNRDWISTIKRAPKTIMEMIKLRGEMEREKGYVLFQEFIPKNFYDTRVTVIGKRAFAFRRMVRPGDFRASGSNMPSYEKNSINVKCISDAFILSKKLGSVCMAYDYIFRQDDENPVLVEMSFAFKPEAVYACEGYWDVDLIWHQGKIRPEDLMIEELLAG